MKKKPTAKKAAKKVPRKRDECTYTPAKGLEICTWIAQGRSLAGYCREHDTGYSTIMEWLKKFPELAENYAHARANSGDAEADLVGHYREMLLRGEITPEQARIAIDSAKWAAGIRQPKKYGPKMEVEHSGDLDVIVTIGGTHA